jgi:hypothetical protein
MKDSEKHFSLLQYELITGIKIFIAEVQLVSLNVLLISNSLKKSFTANLANSDVALYNWDPIL